MRSRQATPGAGASRSRRPVRAASLASACGREGPRVGEERRVGSSRRGDERGYLHLMVRAGGVTHGLRLRGSGIR